MKIASFIIHQKNIFAKKMHIQEEKVAILFIKNNENHQA